jgi:serine/threonine protein kinase
MPDDPSAPQPTPTNYQRTTGGAHLRWQPPTPEHLQEMLPAYEILGILGQGGMGAVYKGRQKSLDRIVAIKILPPEAGEDDMQFVERFKNEARTMAKMNHASIVHVYDFGETTDGQLYIVMEFIDGTDVAKMIQSQGKLPEDYALSITAHVCDALQYAHEHGVVHRDIKPANVLINMEGQVKVADFGLAKATDPSQMGLTKTNMAMGTPDFVSPEALMPGVPLDGRADLYAVGVMLYNMLTGMIPRGAFRMPSITLQTDARFDKIIGKAMEMDRELRYQTALDLRRDLDVILTTPAAKTGMQTIPAQQVAAQPSLPQKPMGKTPQQRSADAPSRKEPAAKPAPAPVRKSNTGMIYGIAAAVVVVAMAVFMFAGGGKQPSEVKPVAESKPETPKSDPKPAPTANTTAPVSKSSDVLTFGGHRYQLLTEKMTWDAAKAKAEALGGHLVTITTREESSFVRDKFLPQVIGLTQNVGMRRLLLGGRKAAPGSPWEWVTGERFDLSQWVGMQSDPKGTESHYLNWDYGAKRWDHSSARMEYFPLVEWDDDGSAKSASTPVAAASTAGAINLLALVDVKRDAVAGDWTMTGKELALAKGIYGALEFQTAVPEEYDFEIEFTPQSDGNNVNQYITAGGQSFAWKLNAHARTPPLYGFELLDGKFSKDTTEARTEISKALQIGTRYRSTIEVRKGSLRALLDGEEIVKWTGDFSRFSMENGTKLSNPKHLGVGAYKRGVVFHKAELRPAGGVGVAAVKSASSPTMPAAPLPSSAPSGPGWMDLMAIADPEKDAEVGLWRREGAGLICNQDEANKGHPLLAMPATVTGSYELELEFTRHGPAGTVSVVLPLDGDRIVTAFFQEFSPFAGLAEVRGMNTRDAENPTRVPQRLENGKRYRARIQVTLKDANADINVTLEDKPLFRYQGPASDLSSKRLKSSLKRGIDLDADRPALESIDPVTWHACWLRPLEGGRVAPVRGDASMGAAGGVALAMSPLVASDPRLAQLEAGYQARYESDAQKAYLAAVATLNQSYVANGISRARAAAQAKGSLGEVTALDAEKAAIEKGSGVQAEDAADTPASLKALRGTYRGALAKITTERDAKAAPLLDLYLKALDVYIAELTQAGKIDEAKQVQALRDAKAAMHPTSVAAGRKLP